MPNFTFCRLLISLFVLSFIIVCRVPLLAQTTSPNSVSSAPFDTLQRQIEEEQKRTMDPALGRVPHERLEVIKNQLIGRQPSGVITNGIPSVIWQERGPSNAGGRTRALLFDPNDPNHKKVWAGSVTGGLWFNTDITDANSSWTPVSDDWQNTFITALAFDPSNPQVMYAGTGDIYDYRAGGGIWKTTNGGQSWARLGSSIPGGSYPSVSYSLSYIQRIVVNSLGHIFAATQYGVAKSTDGGNSWSYSLAPAQNIGASGSSTSPYDDRVTDLEIGTDGTIYASFSPSKIYKSANGTTWTNITPTASALGERTELALAPSTSGNEQVVYAVTRQYNSTTYSQDILWFKKSIDAGLTWTDVTIPAYGTSSIYHFTNGNGYYSLSLAVSPTDQNVVYAGGQYNWFRSTNGGSSWDRLAYSSTYEHGFAFQPGNGSAAVFYNDMGVFFSPDGNNISVSLPPFSNRNTGYRAGEASSAAMRSSAGSQYIISTMTAQGLAKLTQANLSPATYTYSSSSNSGTTFIDEETPTLQLFSQYNSYYSYDNNSSYPQNLFYTNRGNGIADYDSPLNTLYTADYANNVFSIRKVTGIGSAITTTSYFPLTGISEAPSVIKLSRDRSALFVGAYPGRLYKMTGLNQASPTLTSIDNNAFPQYTTISGIEVGATVNELIVTLSNYGIQSIWYTNDGGNSWTGKDQTNYGLPDIPVRSVLVNPQNFKQVLLGTEIGVWSTNDITSSNPNWSFSNAGLANVKVNQLRYRSSDGRVLATTAGRGIFASDIFAIPYNLPTITLTSVSNTSLCYGNTFSVSFTTNGPSFAAGNQFEVWLSDANGDFTNAKRIGVGTSSPISATLPGGGSAVPYGTSYRVKIIAMNPDVESNQSNTLAIGNLYSANLYDRRSELSQYYSSGTICMGSGAILRVGSNGINSSNAIPETYTWSFNGTVINGVSSATCLAQQAGAYTATLKQAGCTVTSATYTINTTTGTGISGYVTSNSYGEPQCDDQPLKLHSGYIGEMATYQWTKDGVDIAGATSSTYTATQTGNYAFRVTDNTCTSTTSPYYIQFGRSLSARAYLGSPEDSLLCTQSGYNNSIYADINSANNYTIQWYRNGIALPNATYQSYWASQPGAYSFMLKQGTCQTRSNTVVMVGQNQIAATINYSNRSKSACPGETRYLSASPSSNASFQWQKDGIDITGATSSYYYALQSGNYTVRITRGTCSATSAPLSLTFSNSLKPVAYSAPDACSGASLFAGDALSGSQYQWYKNGSIINNATGSGYHATQSGTYSVQITNGNCSGTSKEIYISVGNGKTAKPTISPSPLTSQLCANNSVRLSANTYGGSLQWKRNGIAILGETKYQLYANQSGIYSVVVQDGSCQAESDPVEIKIGETTTASISGNALVSAGQAALLPVSFTGPAPWSFTLSNGQSATAVYQNPYLIPVTPNSSTSYQIATLANACGTGTTTGQASVTVGVGSADVSLGMSVSNRTPNVGDVVSYSLTATNAGPENANGIKLQSQLPAGLFFISATTPGVAFANGIVSSDVGTIPANGQVTVSFQATPIQVGTFATSAQIISSQTPDPDSQPGSGTGDGQDDAAMVDLRTPANSNSLATSPNPNQTALPGVISNQPLADQTTADLSLSMASDKIIVNPTQSEIVTSIIKISNRGGATATNTVIYINFSNGYFDLQNNPNWLPVNNQTYKIFIHQLSAGQSSTVSVRWQPTGDGILKAQIFDTNQPDSDSTPGNGYLNGEDDEATISVRMR